MWLNLLSKISKSVGYKQVYSEAEEFWLDASNRIMNLLSDRPRKQTKVRIGRESLRGFPLTLKLHELEVQTEKIGLMKTRQYWQYEKGIFRETAIFLCMCRFISRKWLPGHDEAAPPKVPLHYRTSHKTLIHGCSHI